MKTYLALGLLSSLLLTSCSVDWNNAKEKRIGELEKQVTELKSNKDLDLKKFEFEKQKYEEEKQAKEAKIKNEQLEKYETQCQKNKDEATKTFVTIANSNCSFPGTTDAAFDKCLANLPKDIFVPDNYKENCVQQKVDGTWKGK